MHQHMQIAGHQLQQSQQHDQQPSSQKDCGVSQLACCGYLAAETIDVATIQLSAEPFITSATQFQSVTSAPLDPPPLARA